MPREQRSPARAVLVGIAVTVLAVPGAYLLALCVHPPVTSDGHHVMPIAQVGMALLIGPLLGVSAGVLTARRRSRERARRRSEPRAAIVAPVASRKKPAARSAATKAPASPLALASVESIRRGLAEVTLKRASPPTACSSRSG